MSPKHLEKAVRTQEGNSKLFPRPFTSEFPVGLDISILLIIRFEFKGKEFASGLTNFVLVEKMLLAKLCKCTKKLTSSPGLILGKKP